MNAFYSEGGPSAYLVVANQAPSGRTLAVDYLHADSGGRETDVASVLRLKRTRRWATTASVKLSELSDIRVTETADAVPTYARGRFPSPALAEAFADRVRRLASGEAVPATEALAIQAVMQPQQEGETPGADAPPVRNVNWPVPAGCGWCTRREVDTRKKQIVFRGVRYVWATREVVWRSPKTFERWTDALGDARRSLEPSFGPSTGV